MHQVEELADRIALIHNGRTMLYGSLQEIRKRYATQSVIVRPMKDLPGQLEGVDEIVKQNSHYLLHLKKGVTSQHVLKTIVDQGIEVEQYEIAMPSLDEIFIEVVKETRA
jgi:ABC-2 type transport system ATP-binding protein